MFSAGYRVICLIVVMMICIDSCGVSNADTFILPQGLKVIETDAYTDCVSMTDVIFPEELETIGDNAFLGCSQLQTVTVPCSVVSIGDHAFSPGTILNCYENSYAASWAEENGYPYTIIERPVRYLALLIAQTYEASEGLTMLHGPATDSTAMEAMLGGMSGTPYLVNRESNLTAAGIHSAVSTAFDHSETQDICLLYYSGHGYASSQNSLRGALVGTDNELVTMSELRQLLDAVPSQKKILILDSCYSGSLISTTSGTQSSTGNRRKLYGTPSDLEAINEAIIRTFSTRSRSPAATGEYFILTAASSTEESKECYSQATRKYYGAFTFGLLYGSGYHETNDVFLSGMPADRNGDLAISLKEGYEFALSYASTLNASQHAQAYPTGSDFPLWAK